MYCIYPKIPNVSNSELDEIVSSRNGYYSYDIKNFAKASYLFNKFIPAFDGHVDYVKREIYAPSARRLEYGFVNTTSLGAFSYASRKGSSPEFDFIGINAGAILTIYDIFQRVLAIPDNFPDIGNPSLENQNKSTIPYLYTDRSISGFTSTPSLCDVRNIFATNLSVIAAGFLFNHELTHIQHGHLEYMRDNLSENHWSGKNEIDPLIRQTLEWDADSGSIRHMIIRVLQIEKHLKLNPMKTSSTSEAFLHQFGSTYDASKTLLLATYIILRVYDVEWINEKQTNQTHPLPASRMATIALFIASQLEVMKKEKEKDEFLDHLPHTIHLAETAIANIQGIKKDTRMLESVLNNEFLHKRYMDEMDKCWKSIRPCLDLNKRGGKLPP